MCSSDLLCAARNQWRSCPLPHKHAGALCLGRHHCLPAGAITAAEIAAAGRAAIFIPFGRATDSHQLRNAQEMSRAGAGRLISEAELTPERLTTEIFSLVDQPQEIEKLSTAARGLARPHAARDIVNLIEEAANVQRKRQRANA